MAVRIVDFVMDGVNEKLASMTWKQAEKFVEEGRELLKNKETPEDVWLDRLVRVVAESMNRAGKEISIDELKDQFDIPMLNEMNYKILVISGLRSPKAISGGGAAGESGTAPAPLANSAAV
jgi:hypothetical protein